MKTQIVLINSMATNLWTIRNINGNEFSLDLNKLESENKKMMIKTLVDHLL